MHDSQFRKSLENRNTNLNRGCASLDCRRDERSVYIYALYWSIIKLSLQYFFYFILSQVYLLEIHRFVTIVAIIMQWNLYLIITLTMLTLCANGRTFNYNLIVSLILNITFCDLHGWFEYRTNLYISCLVLDLHKYISKSLKYYYS